MRTLLLKTLLLLALALPAVAQDPAVVAKSVYKLKLDNERVRVFELVFKPGQKIPMHSHPDHVVYFVTPGKLKVWTSDGKSQVIQGKAGDVGFLNAQSHSAQNMGKRTVKAVVVELK